MEAGLGLRVEQIAGLLLTAGLVAILARRLRLPYTVGLVIAGIVLRMLPISLDIHLTKQLIFSVLLPPLIFEAALYIPWNRLRVNLLVILALATLGVLFSAVITCTGMHYLAGWSWTASLLFGILIAATDPISVIATFKEAGVHGRLRLLVEAESLFNDGTAAVLFAVALAATSGGEISAMVIGKAIFSTIVGGVLCGALVAGGLLLLAGRTDDHLVEITFTSIAAYGSFLLAEHFHLSGVLATLTAGIMIGNMGSLGAISDRGREAVESFWEYTAFVVNSLVFLLIGMHAAHENFRGVVAPAAIAILLVTLGRAVAVYPCCALFVRSEFKVEMRHQHILFWGGLRGALALALAMGLPSAVSERGMITTIAFSVVAFSVFIQGMTMTPLLRRMKLLGLGPTSSRSQVKG